MIVRQHVDWWDGYDTLLSDRKPSREVGAKDLNYWLRTRVKGMYYNPLPFQEFVDIPPLRHFPHERLEACMKAESFEGKKVVDIGANMGYYTFMAAEAGAREAIAIETYENGCFPIEWAASLYDMPNITALNINVKEFDFAGTDIVFAFSVLPYLGQPDPEPLMKVLKSMAKNCVVCFIEMGDGGSALKWCEGDDEFRDLFLSSGFVKVDPIFESQVSHSNTKRTLWECRGTV